MKSLINDFLLMLQLLTRIPINKNLQCDNENFKRGAFMLPLVGGIVGLIQFLVFMSLWRVFPGNIVAVFVILTGALVTGGLHIDGLGDTCDGFFSLRGKDKIIEIMKDSRIGTYAGIAIILDCLMKYSVYGHAAIFLKPAMIIASPILGRFSIIIICHIGKTAKSTGSGNLFIGNVNAKSLVISSILTIVICLLLIGVKLTVILFLVTILVTLLFNLLCNNKIGGLTGDTLGANNELVEIMTLIIFIAFSR